MSYLVLARKYRPRNFDEVVGQEAAATGLRNAIESGRVGQAFLFSGPRGVGKTSMARILAKALNCEKGPTPSPCGKCEICRGIESGRDADVQEIDAATYSKVENIRELRETIPYGTMRARTKVLIVDEVHRLSASAFDALLKVLEEPPPHVKFVFATTDPRKVPDTIVSRCQVFEFRRIEEDQIVAALQSICKKEKIHAEENLLRAIARGSQGGLRDSLTTLDQLVAYAGEKPTLADLEKSSGLAGSDLVMGLMGKVLSGERKEILAELDRFWDQGAAEEDLLHQSTGLLRRMLRVKICGAENPLAGGSPDERRQIAKLCESCSVERIERMLTIALAAREKTGYLSGASRALVELALLRMARTGEEIAAGEILERLATLERSLASGTVAAPVFSAPAPSRPVFSPQPVRAPEVSAPAVSRASGEISSPWRTLLDELKETRKSFAEVLLRKGKPIGLEGKEYRIVVTGPTPAEKSILEDRKNLEAAEAILGPALGSRASLAITFSAAGAKSQANESGSSPRLQQALDLFQGKIVED